MGSFLFYQWQKAAYDGRKLNFDKTYYFVKNPSSHELFQQPEAVI
jgi:hypothetical protein